MTLDTPARLTLAVVASAILHTAALFPVKVPSAPYVATPFPASLLKVRLNTSATLLPETAADSPSSSSTSLSDAASAAPAVPSERDAINPPVPQEPADRRQRTAASVAPPPPQAASEFEGQGRPGVRTALPNEVNVRVRLYDVKSEENPTEVMELPTGKYVYFNAPRLKQTSHPLTDAKPLYPTQKLDYPHGAVQLLLLIDEEGKLEKTTVACANPAFEKSAVESVRQMRFAAARDANGPVKTYMMVEFGYGLGAPCGNLPHNLQLQKGPG